MRQCQKPPLQQPWFLSLICTPQLASLMNTRATALTATSSSAVITNNLKAIHKAKEAFIASENSEKIRRVLAHNLRTSGYIKYITGDHVYFKRADSREWHSPTTVLGQDRQQVLLKNGSSYAKVHPCRVQMIPPPPRPTPEIEKTTIEAPSPQKTKLTHCTTSIRPQTDSSSQEKSSSREDDKSDDKDTKDFGNNNKTPSKQQENGQNRHHKTIVPTNIKPNITIEYKLRGE